MAERAQTGRKSVDGGVQTGARLADGQGCPPMGEQWPTAACPGRGQDRATLGPTWIMPAETPRCDWSPPALPHPAQNLPHLAARRVPLSRRFGFDCMGPCGLGVRHPRLVRIACRHLRSSTPSMTMDPFTGTFNPWRRQRRVVPVNRNPYGLCSVAVATNLRI